MPQGDWKTYYDYKSLFFNITINENKTVLGCGCFSQYNFDDFSSLNKYIYVNPTSKDKDEYG